MTGLEHVRKLIRDTERKIRAAGPNPITSSLGLKPAAPAPTQSNAADALVHVDPVSAAWRSQFGEPPRNQYTHPGQYDAALRYHLRMAREPDYHEQARRQDAHLEAERQKRLARESGE
jgi:hypothetical protein